MCVKKTRSKVYFKAAVFLSQRKSTNPPGLNQARSAYWQSFANKAPMAAQIATRA
jgi:hypothetical protein